MPRRLLKGQLRGASLCGKTRATKIAGATDHKVVVANTGVVRLSNVTTARPNDGYVGIFPFTTSLRDSRGLVTTTVVSGSPAVSPTAQSLVLTSADALKVNFPIDWNGSADWWLEISFSLTAASTDTTVFSPPGNINGPALVIHADGSPTLYMYNEVGNVSGVSGGPGSFTYDTLRRWRLKWANNSLGLLSEEGLPLLFMGGLPQSGNSSAPLGLQFGPAGTGGTANIRNVRARAPRDADLASMWDDRLIPDTTSWSDTPVDSNDIVVAPLRDNFLVLGEGCLYTSGAPGVEIVSDAASRNGGSLHFTGSAYPSVGWAVPRFDELYATSLTLEFWAKGVSGTTPGAPAYVGTDYYRVVFYFDGNVEFLFYDDLGLVGTSGVLAGKLSPSTWSHFAFERSGDQWFAYVDGFKTATFTATLVPQSYTHSQLYALIAVSDNEGADIYFSDFRVSKIARYGGNNFTPPGSIYPVSASASTTARMSVGGSTGSLQQIAATPAAVATASGALASPAVTQVMASGSATAITTATAALTQAGGGGIAATPAVTASASASLSLTEFLNTTSVATSAATAVLLQTVKAASPAVATASASANLLQTVNAATTAAATATATATAALSMVLAAPPAAIASATAVLSMDKALSASATVTANATAALTQTSNSRLAVTASATTSATAALGLAEALSASPTATASASAALLQTIKLASTPVASASTSAALTSLNVVAGTPSTSASASASLAVGKVLATAAQAIAVVGATIAIAKALATSALAVSNAAGAIKADNPTIPDTLRTLFVGSDLRTYVVGDDGRRNYVTAESRGYVVVVDARILAPSA